MSTDEGNKSQVTDNENENEDASTDVTTPVAPEASTQSSPSPSLSDEQAASLKESISADVSEKVSQSVIEKLATSLGLTKKEKEELPTDSAELQRIVDERVQDQLRERDAKQEEARQLDETQRTESVNNIVKGWNSQYAHLASSGKVPAIKNAADTNDPGVVARRKIIMAIGKVIEQNKAQGIDYTPTVGDILVNYPQVLSGPPGADLPISGSTAGVSDGADTDYQKDIRGKSFQQIIDGGN